MNTTPAVAVESPDTTVDINYDTVDNEGRYDVSANTYDSYPAVFDYDPIENQPSFEVMDRFDYSPEAVSEYDVLRKQSTLSVVELEQLDLAVAA